MRIAYRSEFSQKCCEFCDIKNVLERFNKRTKFLRVQILRKTFISQLRQFFLFHFSLYCLPIFNSIFISILIQANNVKVVKKMSKPLAKLRFHTQLSVPNLPLPSAADYQNTAEDCLIPSPKELYREPFSVYYAKDVCCRQL